MERTLNENKYKIDSAEKLAKIIKSYTIVVIKISASWCGPCKNKQFLELYHTLKDNYKQQGNVKFVELDIDEDSNILEDKNYFDISVNSVPTFLISANGNFTRKYSGSNHIESINKYILEKIQ
jgi:thiol-disulfide isomerase/thioredoxin